MRLRGENPLAHFSPNGIVRDFCNPSAPESEYLSVHIRSLGDWTTTVHERFTVWRDTTGMAVHIDGPYGTPTFHLPESEHAVAIAAGGARSHACGDARNVLDGLASLRAQVRV